MERRLLPAWVLVARRNPNPQASLRISLLDEERLLQLSQPGVSHLAQPVASFLAFALFMGISMSITAFPVLVRILQDRGIFKTSLGSTATACAAVDDVTAWSMLAFVVAIARATPALAGVLRFHRSAHPNRPPQQRSGLVDLLGRYRGSHWWKRPGSPSYRDEMARVPHLGALMNTRRLMELIDLNIGYDMGILSPHIFTMLVIMRDH